MMKQKAVLALITVLVLGLSAGCHKKIPPPPPQAPAPLPENAPAAKPAIGYFTAEPGLWQRSVGGTIVPLKATGWEHELS